MEKINPRRLKNDHLVRGTIVDSDDAPVKGAFVSPVGIKNKNGHFQGPVQAADRLAITNLRGEFFITSEEAGVQLDLAVHAPGFAPKLVPSLSLGAKPHKICVSVGASIGGTIIHNGKPVVGFNVSTHQQDRTQALFEPRFAVTDSYGRFTIRNLLTHETYVLFASMNDAAYKNYTLPVQKIKTSGDGAETKGMTIETMPCYGLGGRVKSVNGKDIPQGLQVAICRQGVWDSQLLIPHKDGTFKFAGIPREPIALAISKPGYR